jgi:hypothetical protein
MPQGRSAISFLQLLVIMALATTMLTGPLLVMFQERQAIPEGMPKPARP